MLPPKVSAPGTSLSSCGASTGFGGGGFGAPVFVQSLSQPSPFTALPSSHCSPCVTTPLPQRVAVQPRSQPSPSTSLPSSHSSPGPSAPLPHALAVQLRSQPSPFLALPSS